MRTDDSVSARVTHIHSFSGTGETTWRCRSLWAILKCPVQGIFFEGSIRGVTSRLWGGAVDLTAPSIADGYNIAHCPKQ